MRSIQTRRREPTPKRRLDPSRASADFAPVFGRVDVDADPARVEAALAALARARVVLRHVAAAEGAGMSRDPDPMLPHHQWIDSATVSLTHDRNGVHHTGMRDGNGDAHVHLRFRDGRGNVELALVGTESPLMTPCADDPVAAADRVVRLFEAAFALAVAPPSERDPSARARAAEASIATALRADAADAETGRWTDPCLSVIQTIQWPTPTEGGFSKCLEADDDEPGTPLAHGLLPAACSLFLTPGHRRPDDGSDHITMGRIVDFHHIDDFNSVECLRILAAHPAPDHPAPDHPDAR